MSTDNVIDISSKDLLDTFRDMFRRQVIEADGVSRHRLLPTVCCYNETGQKLYAESLYMPTTFLQNEETQIVIDDGPAICAYIREGCNVIDLGTGDAVKSSILLDQLESLGKNINYWAVDITRNSLEQVVEPMAQKYRHVKCRGVFGTYDEAAVWSQTLQGPKLFMSFNCQLGNDEFHGAVKRLSMFARAMKATDFLLLGMDPDQSADRILANYDLNNTCLSQFIRGGAAYSNQLMGHDWYQDQDWSLFQRVEKQPLEHKFVFKARRPVACEPLDIDFATGEEIICMETFKADRDLMHRQFVASGLKEEKIWTSKAGHYDMYLVRTNLSDPTDRG